MVVASTMFANGCGHMSHTYRGTVRVTSEPGHRFENKPGPVGLRSVPDASVFIHVSYKPIDGWCSPAHAHVDGELRDPVTHTDSEGHFRMKAFESLEWSGERTVWICVAAPGFEAYQLTHRASQGWGACDTHDVSLRDECYLNIRLKPLSHPPGEK